MENTFYKKIGGGNKLELYDPENGQYTDKEKSELLELEIGNIVRRYVLGDTNTYPPRLPIYKFHNEEYCKLYVKNCIADLYRILPYEKMDYLLGFRGKGDKSKFFNQFGYKLNNECKEKLFYEIMNGSRFDKMYFDRLIEQGLVVKVPTYINDYNNTRKVEFISIWIYKEDYKFYFVTVIPERIEKNEI